MAPLELSMDILTARHVPCTYFPFSRQPGHALIYELTVYFYSPSYVFLVFLLLHLMYLCAAQLPSLGFSLWTLSILTSELSLGYLDIYYTFIRAILSMHLCAFIAVL